MSIVSAILSVLAILVSIYAATRASHANRIALYEHRLDLYKAFREVERRFENIPPPGDAEVHRFREDIVYVAELLFEPDVLTALVKFERDLYDLVDVLEQLEAEYLESSEFEEGIHFMSFGNEFQERADEAVSETLQQTSEIKRQLRRGMWAAA